MAALATGTFENRQSILSQSQRYSRSCTGCRGHQITRKRTVPQDHFRIIHICIYKNNHWLRESKRERGGRAERENNTTTASQKWAYMWRVFWGIYVVTSASWLGVIHEHWEPRLTWVLIWFPVAARILVTCIAVVQVGTWLAVDHEVAQTFLFRVCFL